MGQSSSREVLFGAPSISTPSHPIGSASYDVRDGDTGDPVTINQPLMFPMSENGNQLYDVYISPISSPFQITAFANPFSDNYIEPTIRPYFDFAKLSESGEGKAISYTYLYSITGWSAFSEDGPIDKYENAIICCSTSSACNTDKYPRSIITKKDGATFEIKLEKSSSDVCVTTLSYTGTNIYTFILTQSRLFALTQDEQTEFQAYLNAYLTAVNMIQHLVGINPFCSIMSEKYRSLYESLLTIQLTYPYMIYAQLIMLESWFSINDKWGTLWEMAINFVSKYARKLWTVDYAFDYGYIEPSYLSLYRQSVVRNGSVWKLSIEEPCCS